MAGASETVNDAAAFGIRVPSNKFEVLLESEKVKSEKIEATYAKLKDASQQYYDTHKGRICIGAVLKVLQGNWAHKQPPSF